MTDVAKLLDRAEKALAAANSSALAEMYLVPELVAALREAESDVLEYRETGNRLMLRHGEVVAERDRLRTAAIIGDAEVQRLVAENARYRTALEIIRSFERQQCQGRGTAAYSYLWDLANEALAAVKERRD